MVELTDLTNSVQILYFVCAKTDNFYTFQEFLAAGILKRKREELIFSTILKINALKHKLHFPNLVIVCWFELGSPSMNKKNKEFIAY